MSDVVVMEEGRRKLLRRYVLVVAPVRSTMDALRLRVAELLANCEVSDLDGRELGTIYSGREHEMLRDLEGVLREMEVDGLLVKNGEQWSLTHAGYSAI